MCVSSFDRCCRLLGGESLCVAGRPGVKLIRDLNSGKCCEASIAGVASLKVIKTICVSVGNCELQKRHCD